MSLLTGTSNNWQVKENKKEKPFFKKKNLNFNCFLCFSGRIVYNWKLSELQYLTNLEWTIQLELTRQFKFWDVDPRIISKLIWGRYITPPAGTDLQLLKGMRMKFIWKKSFSFNHIMFWLERDQSSYRAWLQGCEREWGREGGNLI